ncbi:hypothetical protein Hamer_G022988 [Homarus americanus]|uniref:Uncharacterized protein n=1 Tax=Homarus americanus TaxID=6706 RepID=A0A8J5K131_HOMAM|nr:hypothetical protein Hamer_G022988 [Homarus americanus]
MFTPSTLLVLGENSVLSGHHDTECHPGRYSDTECHPGRYSDTECHPGRYSDTECHPGRYSDTECHPGGTLILSATLDGTLILSATLDGTLILSATLDGTLILSATLDGKPPQLLHVLLHLLLHVLLHNLSGTSCLCRLYNTQGYTMPGAITSGVTTNNQLLTWSPFIHVISPHWALHAPEVDAREILYGAWTVRPTKRSPDARKRKFPSPLFQTREGSSRAPPGLLQGSRDIHRRDIIPRSPSVTTLNYTICTAGVGAAEGVWAWSVGVRHEGGARSLP